MPDLLIRDIDSALKREIEERARKHQLSLSDEAKALIRQALGSGKPQRKLGTEMMNLVPEKYRGDDLVFEYRGAVSKPPDFA